ncbi:MAG: GNAT family N-acetyltransferase [Thalassobaculum sp.]|uniref:GNAT family N-acetyltransferase n=1 Tax=Thalassobaculum sp. TaxID=2022740 RepID=UPI0032EFC7F8
MDSTAIRRAGADDVPAMVRIRAAVRENVLSDPARVPAEAYHGFIDHAGIWLWEEAGRVLGFTAADPADGTVWALFVDPEAEGRGIGRALLPRALDDLRAAGWERARLTTQPGSRAERFYRLGGWKDAGTAPNGDLVLEKLL